MIQWLQIIWRWGVGSWAFFLFGVLCISMTMGAQTTKHALLSSFQDFSDGWCSGLGVGVVKTPYSEVKPSGFKPNVCTDKLSQFLRSQVICRVGMLVPLPCCEDSGTWHLARLAHTLYFWSLATEWTFWFCRSVSWPVRKRNAVVKSWRWWGNAAVVLCLGGMRSIQVSTTVSI